MSGRVFTTGDNQSSTASEFKRCYDPSWGRHKARTKPALGVRRFGLLWRL
jgi:hypothetical protein